MNIQEVLEHLPHRYPFLLIDKVLDHQEGKWLTAVKNVTITEPFFQGHFPGRPIMPGVLILEALAQATGILAFRTIGKEPSKNEIYLFVGIDKARFKRQVGPGDQLILDVKVIRNMRGIWRFEAVAKVDGEVCASAEIMCASKVLDD